MISSEWQTFLQTQGAHFNAAHQIQDFGLPQQEQEQVLQTTVLSDLSHYGLIQVSGADASQFLQGQFTNDVREIKDNYSQSSAWCSTKGRILVNFRLFKRHEDYFLLLPHDSVENTLKRLTMYILRSAVRLTDVSTQLLRIGVSGENSVEILQQSLGVELPAAKNETLTSGPVTVLNISDQIPRYIIVTDFNTMQSLWQQCPLPKVGPSAWDLLDILAGYPHISAHIADAFVPQMVNYELLGGVNFKKGCYAGQEIVARLQYLGNLKQRMYLGRIKTKADCPAPGSNIYAPNNTQSIGQLVNVQPHPMGGCAALAVLQIAHAEIASSFHIGCADGPIFQLETQPYELAVA